MNIYDVKFYGVYFHYKMEFSSVIIYANKEQLHAVPGFENLFFEVSVIKEYGGQKDVLKIEFEDGTYEYETLSFPYLYLDDSVWKKSNDRAMPDAFTKVLVEQLLLQN